MINTTLRNPLVLPDDVQIVPIDELSDSIRKQLNGEEGDYALSRPRSRQTSKLINGDVAALLEYFRTPHTFVKVIALYCRQHHIDPEKTLEDVLPIIKQMIGAGFLVPENADAVERIRPTMNSGDQFAGYRIVQCVQVLDDSELYQARRADGAYVAIKLGRSGREAVVKPRLDREVAILHHLDGSINPEMLSAGDSDGRTYIALTWCAGVDAAAAASEMRSSGDRTGVLRLIGNIARAYANLHRQGVIHGDVHPANLLVDSCLAITIIDYGLSDVADKSLPPSIRGGVGFFYDPEQASALLEHLQVPPADAADGVAAALCHCFVSGAVVP